MGRFIAVLLFVVLLVPAYYLAKAWARAAFRREVTQGTLSLTMLTGAAEVALKVQAVRARRWRLGGVVAAIVLGIAAVFVYAESAVFIWPGLIVAGVLGGILLGEVGRLRPAWEKRHTPRQRQREVIDSWLPLVGRVSAVALLVIGSLAVANDWGALAVGAAAVGLVGWLLVEFCLERMARRSAPADSADSPVDDALRTASAHVAVGAGSIGALLVLSGLLIVGGILMGDDVQGADLRPIALIASAFGCLVAALVVSVFLVRWMPPVRWAEPAWGATQSG